MIHLDPNQQQPTDTPVVPADQPAAPVVSDQPAQAPVPEPAAPIEETPAPEQPVVPEPAATPEPSQGGDMGGGTTPPAA